MEFVPVRVPADKCGQTERRTDITGLIGVFVTMQKRRTEVTLNEFVPGYAKRTVDS